MGRGADPGPERDGVVAVLGCGAVGRALAAALGEAGRSLVLWSRSPERAAELAALLPDRARARTVDSPGAALSEAEVALLCVSDEALRGFVDRCAAEGPVPTERSLAIHTNGSLGLEVLAPLEALGWGVGRLHPLVALPPGGTPDPLAGRWYATAARPGQHRALSDLVAALGGFELPLAEDEEAGARLHAAAALLSGGLVALMDAALSLAGTATADREAAAAALGGLLTSTAENLGRRGPRAALTGPLARGATTVVECHLAALDARDPEAGRLYRELGRRMLALAAERGSIDGEQRARLERLLEAR